MGIQRSDLTSFLRYNKARNLMMAKPSKGPKTSLTQKLVATWLKHDPFVKIVARDNEEIRRDAMMALVGDKAAKAFFGKKKKRKEEVKPVYPNQVRQEETKYLEKQDKRDHIIRQLVFWGTNEDINKENPESHTTRIQIVHSLLGPIFLNSTPKQEKVIVDGLKVLVISRPTSLGKAGEPSPLVHKEIIQRVSDILKHDDIVRRGKQDHRTETAMRAHLIKTIQTMKDKNSRSAYYVADDRRNNKRIIAEKFPLEYETKQGLLEIIHHYTFSAWTNFRTQAKNLLEELGEDQFDTREDQK